MLKVKEFLSSLTGKTLVEIINGSVSNGAYYAEELLKNSPFLDMYIKERGIDTHIEKAEEVVALDSIMRNMYFQGGHVIPYLSVEIQK